jgi:hypothetical protein
VSRAAEHLSKRRRALLTACLIAMTMIAVWTVWVAYATWGHADGVDAVSQAPLVGMPAPPDQAHGFLAPAMDAHGNTLVGPDGEERCVVLGPPQIAAPVNEAEGLRLVATNPNLPPDPVDTAANETSDTDPETVVLRLSEPGSVTPGSPSDLSADPWGLTVANTVPCGTAMPVAPGSAP